METATTRANLQRYCMALVKSGLSTPLSGMTTSSIKEPIKDAEYVFWYYQTGDKVRKVNGFMEKGGYQIRKTGRS